MASFDRDGALKRAEKALRQGRIDAAIAEYLHVTEAEPRDWTSAQALGDLYVRAGQLDRALAQYARTADHLATEGMHAEALALFQKSLKLKPGDEYATTRIRQVSQEIGLSAGHDAPFFTTEGQAGGHRASPVEPAHSSEVEELLEGEDDRSPWFTMAEIALREGRLEEGRVAVAEALQFDPSSREAALAMAYRIAPISPDAGYQVIDAIVDRCIDDNDYAAAAAALQEFVTRVRFHLVALMRLVEVAMEGGLEATMYEAQAQLTDAYLDAGRGLEARVISEDLVAREPWNRANIERFRKALALLGEPDPDGVIAGRLSGESPFLATDLIDFNRQEEGEEGLEAFDGEEALEEASEDASEEASARDEAVVATTTQPVASTPPLAGEERAIAQYRLGLAFRDLGLLDDAVRALEAATESESLRFKAASLLGGLHRRRGHSAPAVEWLDRAARWAPPATDIGRAVRYDLGGALEDVGDHDRALAVYTGLESEQIGYRDVSVRIQRLLESKPQG